VRNRVAEIPREDVRARCGGVGEIHSGAITIPAERSHHRIGLIDEDVVDGDAVVVVAEAACTEEEAEPDAGCVG
jgi:hypothetical protein